MAGHGNMGGTSWLASDDLLNSSAALDVFNAEERDRRQRSEGRSDSPEYVRSAQIGQLERSGYKRGTDASTGKTMWFKKGVDGRIQTCNPHSDLLLPTAGADEVFSPPTSPVKQGGGFSSNPAPQASLRRLDRVHCGMDPASDAWLVGQSTSNLSYTFTHKLKDGEERIYRRAA